MGMLQVIVTSVINPSTNNEWTVSRGSTGEEARNAAHHRKHSSSSYVSETVFGSPQNNATPTPRSSFEARKGSFSSLAESKYPKAKQSARTGIWAFGQRKLENWSLGTLLGLHTSLQPHAGTPHHVHT